MASLGRKGDMLPKMLVSSFMVLALEILDYAANYHQKYKTPFQ